MKENKKTFRFRKLNKRSKSVAQTKTKTTTKKIIRKKPGTKSVPKTRAAKAAEAPAVAKKQTSSVKAPVTNPSTTTKVAEEKKQTTPAKKKANVVKATNEVKSIIKAAPMITPVKPTPSSSSAM